MLQSCAVRLSLLFSTNDTDFSLRLGAYFTSGFLNPTRSLGLSVVAYDFFGYHYIYWFGPAMGALLAGGYYKFVKYFNYEEANPGQDTINEQGKERETA